MTVGYVQRLGRIFEAIQVLDLYPAGLEISDLAALLGCSEDEVRADLAAHNEGTDLGPVGMTAWVEFLARLPEPREADEEGPDQAGDKVADDVVQDVDDEADDALFVPADQARAVRLHRAGATSASGGMSLADVGAVLVAAEDLALSEPGNTALAEVIAQLRARWLPAVTEVWRPSFERLYEADLTVAIEKCRRVRITYDRAWKPGVVTRLIEPYALVRTHRGFEVDAAVPGTKNAIRTYLVDHILELEVTDEVFERPADAEARCLANRRSFPVEVVMAKDRAWVAEFLAEQVEVVSADDDVQLRLQVFEPVRPRVGLTLLQAGPESFVTSPEALADADHDVALELLAHHGL